MWCHLKKLPILIFIFYIFQVSLEDFLESCRAPALLTELEDDDEGDDALDSDKENEPAYQDLPRVTCVSILNDITPYFISDNYTSCMQNDSFRFLCNIF